MQKIMSKKIIAICGSYGKTTLKEILFQVLSSKFKVLQSFGNENTPLGISKLVEKLTSEHEILLLEFGEFVVGDIRSLCGLFPPNIGIITGINNQHNERIGGIQNAIKCMFEIAEFCKTLILNIDDENVRENWQKFVQKDQEIWFYSSENNPQSSLFFQKAEFDKESLSWKVEMSKEKLDSVEKLIKSDESLSGNSKSKSQTENKQNTINSSQKLVKNLENKSGNHLELSVNQLENDYILDSLDKVQTRNETEIFEIKLLGKYAIGKLICGLIIGKTLKMTDLEIKLGLQNVCPISHRLEPIWNEKSQILVIDDSYNGNIDGVLEAIEVLTRLK